MIPKRCFFTKGVGVHKERLASFELALRQAGLAFVTWFSYRASTRLAVNVFPGKRVSNPCDPAKSYSVFMTARAPTSPTAWSLLLWAWLFPQIRSSGVICPSIIRSGKQKKRPASTPKTWPRACWRQLWESNSIRILHGTSEKACSKCPARSCARRISRNRPLAIKTGCGPLSSPRARSSTTIAARLHKNPVPVLQNIKLVYELGDPLVLLRVHLPPQVSVSLPTSLRRAR